MRMSVGLEISSFALSSRLGRVFYLDPGDAGVEDGGGAVGDGKFVVPGRDTAPLLVEGEGAFDDVAILVCVRVEGGWSATAAPSPFAGADLVAFLWDHGRDSSASKPTADHSTGVSLVSQNRVGAGSWPAATRARNPDIGQNVLQHGPVVALAAGDHYREGSALAVDGVMDFRRPPTPGSSDPMTRRLNLRQWQILVIRGSPLCPGQGGWCSSHADAHGRSSRPR